MFCRVVRFLLVNRVSLERHPRVSHYDERGRILTLPKVDAGYEGFIGGRRKKARPLLVAVVEGLVSAQHLLTPQLSDLVREGSIDHRREKHTVIALEEGELVLFGVALRAELTELVRQKFLA